MEALSYLESMCRDMGRSHEEYSRKLEKLRRSQPASAATGNTQQQTGAGKCRYVCVYMNIRSIHIYILL